MKEKSRLEWVAPDNPEQCEWAIHYLIKRGAIHKQAFTSHYEALINWNNTVTKDINYADLLIQMQQAWKQKKHRGRNKHKKTCNLTLSIAAKSKLDTLSKKRNKSMSACFEELIMEENSTEKKIKLAANELQEKHSKNIEKYKQAIKVIEKILDSALLNLIELEQKDSNVMQQDSDSIQHNSENLQIELRKKRTLFESKLTISERQIYEFAKRII